jgi:hypothetical protein
MRVPERTHWPYCFGLLGAVREFQLSDAGQASAQCFTIRPVSSW